MIKQVIDLEKIKVGDRFIVKVSEKIYGYACNDKGFWIDAYRNVEIVRITPKKTKWIIRFNSGEEKEITGTRSYTGVLRLNISLLTFEEEDITTIENTNNRFIGIKRIFRIARGLDIKIEEQKILSLSDNEIKILSLNIADLFEKLNVLSKEDE